MHSRFRPHERRAAMRKLESTVPVEGRIAISTQVLEAGVDLDANVLVSEICPWPSLVQRLGRLNRRGKKEGTVRIFEVPVRKPDEGWPRNKNDRAEAESEAALPYEWCDLKKARDRVAKLSDDASILAIERIEKNDPYRIPVEGHVLRKHHLQYLFDTDSDLSGGHFDVSAFVRSDEADLSVAVIWRALGRDDDSPKEQAIPHPDEICRVPIADLRKIGSGKPGWLLGLQRSRRRSGAWRETRLNDLRPGDTVMLDISAGGYNEELGWVGSEEDRPSSWVSMINGRRSWVGSDGNVVDRIDVRNEAWAGREDDPGSCARRWMELPDHLSNAEREAGRLAKSLVPQLIDQLAIAGRWHDVGKALERDVDDDPVLPFQEMLRSVGVAESTHPSEGVEYAKSNRPGGSWRPGGHRFRHEAASALAFLTENGADADDLVAWLVMAHHGRVRMTPTPWNDLRMDDVVGVRSGDRIPARIMALVGREEACNLDLDVLIPSVTHPGWQGRVVKLLEEHGSQFLAYLETLVRVADWRASR